MSYSKKIIVYINRRKAGMEDNIMEDSEIIELYFNKKIKDTHQLTNRQYRNLKRNMETTAGQLLMAYWIIKRIRRNL